MIISFNTTKNNIGYDTIISPNIVNRESESTYNVNSYVYTPITGETGSPGLNTYRTLAISVNGNFADEYGNIETEGGGSTSINEWEPEHEYNEGDLVYYDNGTNNGIWRNGIDGNTSEPFLSQDNPWVYVNRDIDIYYDDPQDLMLYPGSNTPFSFKNYSFSQGYGEVYHYINEVTETMSFQDALDNGIVESDMSKIYLGDIGSIPFEDIGNCQPRFFDNLTMYGEYGGSLYILSSCPFTNEPPGTQLISNWTLFAEVNKDSGGDYIPLSGTEEGNPITGNLEMFDGFKIGSGNFEPAFHRGSDITFGNEQLTIRNSDINISPRRYASITLQKGDDEFPSEIIINTDNYRNDGDSPGGKGLVGVNYYGDNYDEFTYVQKKYVDQANSYSTEETKTGGTWIDGKPIYRKVINGIVPFIEDGSRLDIDITSLNIENCINTTCIYGGASVGWNTSLTPVELEIPINRLITPFTVSNEGETYNIILEYTKTTSE